MSDKARPRSDDPAAAKAAAGGTSSGPKSAPVSKPKPAGHDDEVLHSLAPAQAADELGRLAHYRVLKILGKGGMGTVFMAEDTKLHRIVALKVMLPAIAKKAVARDRFIREARAMAKIEHDHIITIYEVSGEDIEIPYAAMQYLKGMTLDDWLRAGKSLNIPQILRIGKEIAKGLAAAHAQNLIHRDIKPSNIWLDAVNKGRVKILDFGLARPTNEETHLTQEGMILGTPAYMAPEQARGWNVDERCDLFSLGCVLYRLVAGKLPFSGKDTMSMLLAITSEEPAPLQQLNSDAPAGLVELVHKLLAKKPEDRPGTAKQVVQAIQDIEREWIGAGKTVTARPIDGPSAGAKDATVTETKGVEADPALEDSAITELELQTPIPSPQSPPAPARGRGWLLAGLGGASIAVITICCCFGATLTFNQGNIKVVAEDDEAKAILEKHGIVVRDHNKKEHTLKSENRSMAIGGYEIDTASLPPGLRVEKTDYVLHRMETITIKVRYVMPRPSLTVLTRQSAKRTQHEWAAYLKREVIETNSIGAKMVLIPPGEFTMGTPDDVRQLLGKFTKRPDKERVFEGDPLRLDSETPQHRVRITRPFYVGATEVTVDKFQKFIGAMKKYETEPEANRKGGTGIDGSRSPEFNWRSAGRDYIAAKGNPVSNITWRDADAFCKWLSEKEGKVYRLPTEAEWEYACRAGTTDLWHFGNELFKKEFDIFKKENAASTFMWYHLPGKLGMLSPTSPRPVGQKKSNDFGLFDMHGNVWEMCSDYWAPNFYAGLKDVVTENPTGPEPKKSMLRVVRGGSYADGAFAARSGFRHFVDPSAGFLNIGFRVVCEISWPQE